MGQIRIIGGQWKRTPISVDDAKGLRPTADRVRETLFNWLGQNLSDWRCLDVFAGTGALGFEAGSRGAREVVFIEQDLRTAQRIQSLIEKLGAFDRLSLVRADALAWLKEKTRSPISDPFDLIFCDPPFGLGLIEKTAPLLVPLLAADGYLYAESERPLTPDWAQSQGLTIIRKDKAGMVHYHLLRRFQGKEEPDADSSLSGNI